MAAQLIELISDGDEAKINQLKNKVEGMLTGVMLGDSLGRPHEFHYQTDVYTGKLIYRSRHLSRWTGTKYAENICLHLNKYRRKIKDERETKKLLRSTHFNCEGERWGITIR